MKECVLYSDLIQQQTQLEWVLYTRISRMIKPRAYTRSSPLDSPLVQARITEHNALSLRMECLSFMAGYYLEIKDQERN